MDKKEELKHEIYLIEKKEEADKEKKAKEENFKKFQNRCNDWVIGKSHADIEIVNIDGYWGNSKCTIGKCISIHGNVGQSYNANAQITTDTNTYFHNVWSDKQKNDFQNKMNELALKEITKIMNNLHQKLEIMGLQSNKYFIENVYPADKVEIINKDIWKETCKVIDKYKDKDFLDLIKLEKGWFNGDTNEVIPPFYDVQLNHSSKILFDYIKEKRKHLIKKFEKCRNFY